MMPTELKDSEIPSQIRERFETDRKKVSFCINGKRKPIIFSITSESEA